MAQTVIPAGRRQRRAGLIPLMACMVFVAGAPAWSGPPEEQARVEVDQVAVDPGTIENLGEPGLVVPTGVFVYEAEPNNTATAPQALTTLPARVRGMLYRAPFVTGDIDEDVYSFSAPAGARVYAATMTSWSSGSTDSELDILDTDGTTVLETDDDNGSFATTSSVIAGTVLTTGGTYYVRVRQGSITSLSGTIRPYDLYLHVASGAPTAEVEPNNNGQTPNPIPAAGWMSGAVDPVGDTDTFSFTANAGDTIVVIQDLDPERDTPDWNGRVGVGVFNNFFLVTSDTPVAADLAPSEAIFMTAKNTGNYVVYVDAQVAGVGGPAATYHFAAFVIPGRPRTCTTYQGTGGPIGDLGTTDFTMAVPDARTVDYLKVSVSATHAVPGDLDVTLVGPDGNEVALFDDVTLSAGGGTPQIDVTLEDEAGVPMALFGVHSGMHYIPELGARLEYFKGMQAQGNWILRMRDDLTANAGTLNSWSITVCEPEPRPACQVPGPGEITVLATDFEADDGGFTHSGTLDEWERGLPSFNPLTSAHSGANAFKTDLDGQYENNALATLVSPVLDLRTVSGRATASWWMEYQMESASFDSFWVEIQRVGNPASARRLFVWTGSTMTRTIGNPSTTILQDAGWGLYQADVSDFVGSLAELRFHMDTDGSVQHTGVAVDDVRVTACPVVVGSQISNVGITKTDGQTTYFPGQTLTYTIVASNAGPAAVVRARVVDDFPAELENITWTCAASAGSACGSASGTGNIDTTVNLLLNGTATFTATATVAAGASAPIVNTASIAVPAGWGDPTPANNAATDTDVLASAEPQALAVDAAGNGVFEPDETVVVAPTWMNTSAAAYALTGSLTNHTGPAGATYAIPDGLADYGTPAAGATVSCTATGNCYSVSNAMTTRPALHWDSTADEEAIPTGAIKTWTLHIGASFADVSTTNPFYRFIETLLHNGVTGGCTGTDYCPSESTTREQMAVFVLVAKEGAGYTPPACDPPNFFSDVPETSPFCRFIEELANRLVVTGCGVNLYCPTAAVLRDQMAVFVLRTLDPTLDPPACVAGSEMFADLPASSGFCRWVEELARRGVVTGCGGGNYCPGDPVTREQMGVFLSVTFGLALYGV